MNRSILETVCIPLCQDGGGLLASALYDAICQKWPQINRKTTVRYIRHDKRIDLLPVQFNPVTKSANRRRSGFAARICRVMFELTALRQFARLGWESVLYQAMGVTRLTYTLERVGIRYSPEIFGHRSPAHPDLNPVIAFHGFYEPMGDVLFWKRPEYLWAERDVTRADTRIDGALRYMPPYPEPDAPTLPRPPREILFKPEDSNNPTWIDSEKPLKLYKDWFNSGKESPPAAPESHEPDPPQD